MLAQNRAPGISFVIRVRDEEALLRKSLDSLKGVQIPHEIIVVCHICTDGSKAVAEAALTGGQPIRIFEYTHPISRPGYECLVTPPTHPASLAYYYNWCFSKATYNWIFKWDADFIASSELLNFLNTELKLDERSPIRYHMPCVMSQTITNKENYLYNCLAKFAKYIFWETGMFYNSAQQIEVPHRIYTIPPTILKPYWLMPPWFSGGKDPVLEERLKKVIEICGPEPVGASRASCKECEVPWFSLMAHRAEVEALGIQFVE
jgi:glycosyltransferase involved in cell wall biosynthesis